MSHHISVRISIFCSEQGRHSRRLATCGSRCRRESPTAELEAELLCFHKSTACFQLTNSSCAHSDCRLKMPAAPRRFLLPAQKNFVSCFVALGVLTGRLRCNAGDAARLRQPTAALQIADLQRLQRTNAGKPRDCAHQRLTSCHVRRSTRVAAPGNAASGTRSHSTPANQPTESDGVFPLMAVLLLACFREHVFLQSTNTCGGSSSCSALHSNCTIHFLLAFKLWTTGNGTTAMAAACGHQADMTTQCRWLTKRTVATPPPQCSLQGRCWPQRLGHCCSRCIFRQDCSRRLRCRISTYCTA